MRDLKQRFGSLDSLEAPDLWTEAELRSPGRPRRSQLAGRRWVAAAVAFVVAVAGFGVAVWAFRGPSSRPTPEASPVENGRIAFSWYHDGSSQIYTANPDGSGLTKVTDLKIDVGAPTWSPDGTKIAFEADTVPGEGGRLDIYVANADGTGIAKITDGPDSYQDPAWSPDGTRIAATRWSAATEHGDLVLINVDGTGLKSITSGGGDSWRPDWSPDGSRIAFQSNRDGGNSDIYVANADGTGATNLTNSPAYDGEPAWSPDGTKIVFVAERSQLPLGQVGLYAMNPDGSDVQELVANVAEPGASPVWSPDGTEIAFVEHGNRLGSGQLFEVDPATGTVTPMMDLVGVGSPAWAAAPVAAGPSEAPTPTPSETSSPSTSAASGDVAATIDVGDSGSIAFGEGSIWTVQRNASSLGGTVLRIDPATNEIVARIPVDTVPQWETGGGGLTVANGSVWVAGSIATRGGGSEAGVEQIDTSTNALVDTVRLGGRSAEDVAVGSDGSIWVLTRTDSDEPGVVKLDGVTHRDVANLQSLNAFYGRRIFANDGGAILDLTEPPNGPIDSTTVVALNPGTGGTIGSTWKRNLPYSATAESDGQFWAATGRTLEQLDPTTGQTIGDAAAVSNTGDVLAVGDSRVWFLEPEDRGVLHGYDPVTGTVDVNVDLGKASTPIAIATSPGSVWVLDYLGTLTRIDLG